MDKGLEKELQTMERELVETWGKIEVRKEEIRDLKKHAKELMNIWAANVQNRRQLDFLKEKGGTNA